MARRGGGGAPGGVARCIYVNMYLYTCMYPIYVLCWFKGGLLVLTESEWRVAAASVHPAALLGLGTSRSALGGAKWSDVGGLRAIKRRLKQ